MGGSKSCRRLWSPERQGDDLVPLVSTKPVHCDKRGEVEIDEHAYLASHRSHEVNILLKRWRAVARGADLRVVNLLEEGQYPVLALYNRRPISGQGLYLSAGIHGDEPAAVQGLVQWAEENPGVLRENPVVILPCLNPWGLSENRREDQEGCDLNRCFARPGIKLIGAIRDLIAGRFFAMAVNLHEDFDANGIYLYELARRGEKRGEALLEAVEQIIPRHHGAVDGKVPKNGVIRRTNNLHRIAREIDGMPESIHLFLNGARTAFTFETPSEYSLYRRLRCHVRFLEGVVELAGCRT